MKNGNDILGRTTMVVSLRQGLALVTLLLGTMDSFSSISHAPLRICIMVEPSPLTYVSGYANRFQALLHYLVENTADDVQVVTTETLVQDRPNEWMGIPVHYTFGVRLPHYPSMSLSADCTLKALRVVWQTKPDIIHVTSPGFFVFSGWFLSRIFHIPLIMSYHTHVPIYVRSYLPRAFGISRIAEWLTWRLVRLAHGFADLTVVTSPQILEEFQHHRIPRCDVWQKGIDTTRFHPSFSSTDMRTRMTGGHVSDFLIVCIGRLGSEKRVKDLRDILDALPDARLCIVGTGPQEAELQAYFNNTRTVFTGQLTGVELSQAFACADVFCMPSDSETLGFVVLESMASGVPVVAANAGGIPNLIDDGKTGYLVPPGDTAAFVDRLRRLQTQPNVRADMALAGRQETERWSWESSMSKLRHEQYNKARANFHQRFEQRLWRVLTFNKTPIN
jgi:sulfoquinovosyltransferase